MRAFVDMWDEITAQRYGINDPKQRLFRYGVQVNSLGLTEPQPENNVYRIFLEMLAVTLSKKARARAVQLPAWNEALGLPRPFDQQWSLRAQQILAYELDLLEYGDIFDGSIEIANKVEELKRAAKEELATIERLGGAVAAVEMGYMKQQLVESNTRRLESIESGDSVVVGVNKFTESEPSPLTGGIDAIMTVSHEVEAEQIARLNAWRNARDAKAVDAALKELRRAARPKARNVMPASIACAKAGVTTGEWGAVFREVFGEYRAPTGVPKAARQVGGDVARAGSRRGRARLAQARPAHEIPGRQARPRRPFQRRRADRGARARRRHGRDLCRHPLHAGRTRQDREGRRRRRDRAVDPLGQPRAAGARRGRPHARGRARATCRSWSAASCRRRTKRR